MKNVGDYESIHSLNHLYLIIDKVNGYIEESNGNKYLVFAAIDKKKSINGIKNLIERVNDKPGEYGKDFLKMKFK